ncbi:ATP-binding protein [Streptomyces sp. NPDC016309]|uniref:ATP-binding protein n=1 Tax=Streptomyces sp. NPDC016309 TaxID=3364965 RepID=UPI0036F868E9
MPICLSPQVPGWSPRTEAGLQAAIEGGPLEETHYLGLKKALAATKGDSRELARDIASFAVDGGTLIIGIAEDKDNCTFFRAPQPLKGLGEKVEQVARAVPDPPLTVVTTDIPSAANEEHGYLVVHIPAGPAAPCMVDGRYYGRGDKTTHVLSDRDVVRLHERHRFADQAALELMEQQIETDPLAGIGEQSHLFLVAHPPAGRRDTLLKRTSDPQWGQRLSVTSPTRRSTQATARICGTTPSAGARLAERPFTSDVGVAGCLLARLRQRPPAWGRRCAGLRCRARRQSYGCGCVFCVSARARWVRKFSR